MPLDLPNLLRPLRDRLASKLNSRSSEAAILLTPGECFVCRKIDLPEGLPEKEIASFAQCALEGFSPFPLEQLMWGYLREKRAQHILLYAALQKTLHRRGITDWERYLHTFPHFIAGVGPCFTEPTVAFFSHGTSLSALFYAPDNPLPLRVESVEVEAAEQAEEDTSEEQEPDGNDDESLQDARCALVDSLHLDDDSGYTLEDTIRRVGEPYFDREQRLRFPCEAIAATPQEEQKTPDEQAKEGAPEENAADTESETSAEEDAEKKSASEESPEETLDSPMTQDQLWEADSRDKSFIAGETKKRKLAKQIDMGAVAAGAVAGALIAGQAGFQAGDIVLENRQAIIQEQEAAVQAIESNANLLGQLRQFEQGDLNLFEILEMMNQDRPKTVYFTQAAAKKPGEVEVDGSSKNVEDLNRYVDRLNALPQVSAVPVFKSSDTEGTTFQLTVTFDAAAQSEPQEAERADEDNETLVNASNG